MDNFPQEILFLLSLDWTLITPPNEFWKYFFSNLDFYYTSLRGFVNIRLINVKPAVFDKVVDLEPDRNKHLILVGDCYVGS